MRDKTGLFVVGESYTAWRGVLWRINVALALVIDPCEFLGVREGGAW